MRKIYILAIALLTLFFNSVTAQNTLETTTPKDWVKRITPSEDAIIGTDTVVKHWGRASGFIKAPYVAYEKYAGIAQHFDATPYRSKRIKVSAYIKSKDLFRGNFGLLIYGTGDSLLNFESTRSKWIEETTDWHLHEIVFDVPNDAVIIDFSIFSFGDGTIWVDDCSFAVVDKNQLTPVTTISPTKGKLPKPPYTVAKTISNLDFESFN